jgi:hypothetical protein
MKPLDVAQASALSQRGSGLAVPLHGDVTQRQAFHPLERRPWVARLSGAFSSIRTRSSKS